MKSRRGGSLRSPVKFKKMNREKRNISREDGASREGGTQAGLPRSLSRSPLFATRCSLFTIRYSLFAVLLLFTQCSFSQSDRAVLSEAARRAGMDRRQHIAAMLDRYRDSLFTEYLQHSCDLSAADEQPTGAGETRLRVCHIYKRLRQNITPAELNRVTALFDAVSDSIAHGTPFEHFLQTLSDEKEPFTLARRQLPPEIESTAFRLEPGQVSKPVLSPAGIHIIKVIGTEPESHDPTPTRAVALTRSEMARAEDRLKQTYGYSPDDAAINTLLSGGKTDGPLFHIGGQAYDERLFALYAQAHPGLKQRQWEGFVSKSVLDYAYAHFTDGESAEAVSYKQHSDSLLAHAYIDEAISPQVNERTLKAYFDSHRSDYRYPSPRYRGVVVHAVDKKTAREVRHFLKQLPEAERVHAAELTFGDNEAHPEVITSQGLFKIGDDPFVDAEAFRGPKPQPIATHPVTICIGRRLRGPDDYHEVSELVEADLRRQLTAELMSRLHAERR